MSADRELLELAAKAAGIVGKWATGHHAYGTLDIEGIDTGSRFWWNPLVDDGDALRLAVKLELNVCQGTFSVMVEDEDDLSIVDFCGSDRLATTRRLIVRAAAEIGKEMP